MRFEVKKEISASPERVWSILTNAKTLQNGSFGIKRIEGDIAAGGRIKLWSEANADRAFPLSITEFAPNRRMVWQSGMPLGLFKGVRQFNLTPSMGGVTFHMQEDYSGLLSGLITRSIPDLNPSFETFAAGLKTSAERHLS